MGRGLGCRIDNTGSTISGDTFSHRPAHLYIFFFVIAFYLVAIDKIRWSRCIDPSPPYLPLHVMLWCCGQASNERREEGRAIDFQSK